MKPEFPNEEYFISLANTAIQPCRYIPPRDIENFVDLRLFADDAKILKNPHKGWYWHYIDNGFPAANIAPTATKTTHSPIFLHESSLSALRLGRYRA